MTAVSVWSLAADLLDPQPPDVGHRYTPRGACADAFAATDREVLVSGPAGTGKSRACLERVHDLALRHRGMKALLVRKTATSLSTSALRTWEEFVVAEAMAAGLVWYYGGSAREPAQYRYDNGSRVVIGGMDKATKIMSTEYDVVYVQEAIEVTEDDWEALTTRLRNYVTPHQQLLADTNPSTPTHWLHERCRRRQTRMIESRHTDNPVLYTDTADGWVLTDKGRDYMAILDALTGVRRQRLRDGLWVAAEGMIYTDWDPAVHVVDRFAPPAAWRRWWAVDFGYTAPFVLQWWAEDPDGRLILYREMYRTGRIVADHAAAALEFVTDAAGAWTEPRPDGIVCDHDAEDRATLTRELGLPTVAADKRVKVGIETVQRRMRPAGDGRPRLVMMRDATVARDPALVAAKLPASTADEVPGYVWHPKRDDVPLAEHDHGMDAMRYVVMHRERPSTGDVVVPTGSVPRIGGR